MLYISNKIILKQKCLLVVFYQNVMSNLRRKISLISQRAFLYLRVRVSCKRILSVEIYTYSSFGYQYNTEE